MNERFKPGRDKGSESGLVTSRTPLLEWIAGAVGLLITLTIFGVVGWEAFAGSDETPPAIEAGVERVTPVAGGYVVEVRLQNHSRETAAAVQIEGELPGGDGQSPVTSTSTIDYVPGESVRHVGLVFREDPRRRGLEVRVTGYSEP